MSVGTGAGYPDGLAEKEIPYASRIVFCCDAYNAMTTDRVYREAMSPAEAIAELKTNSGTQFDPDVSKPSASSFESAQLPSQLLTRSGLF